MIKSKWIFLGIFLLYNNLLAQSEIAIIQDPDGYTNIRSGESISCSIIDVIHENEKFIFHKNNTSDWWKVEKAPGIKGYIHKSRIRPIGEKGYLIDGQIYSVNLYEIKFKNYEFKNFNIEIISLSTIDNKKDYDEERIYCRCWLMIKKEDSLLTKLYYSNIEPLGSCGGIYSPEIQPLSNYFIASKFGDYGGEILIIDKNGKLKKEGGGPFFITKDNQYLITDWDADISGITVYDIKNDIVIFSDEINFYIGEWYEIDGFYYARTDKRVEKEDILYKFDYNKKVFDKTSLDVHKITNKHKVNYYNNMYELKDCVCE